MNIKVDIDILSLIFICHLLIKNRYVIRIVARGKTKTLVITVVVTPQK
jgi:hypothetical protein